MTAVPSSPVPSSPVRLWRDLRRNGLLSWLVQVVGVAALYYLTGQLGLQLALPPGYATAIWPPSGISLAAVLLGGYRVWPGIVLGEVMVTMSLSGDVLSLTNLVMSASTAIGASLQAMVGAMLVRRLTSWSDRLTEPREIGLMLVYGGLGACLISATIGTFAMWMAGLIPLSIVPRHWTTWWAGDVMGVFVITPLALMLRDLALGRGRRRALVTCFWIGCTFTATVLAVSYTTSVDRDKQRGRFEHDAEEMVSALQGILDDHVGALRTVEGFYAGADRRGLAEFTLFSRRLREQVAGLQSIQWVPRVAAVDRAGFENWVRQQGLSGFLVSEREDGRMVTARPRSEYYPISFVEPMTGNLGLLGYDQMANPDLRDVLADARDRGQPAVSPRLRLLQGDDGAVLAMPLFENGTPPETLAQRRDKLRGFALGVIRLRGLTRMAFDGRDLDGINYWLEDESQTDGQGAPIVLATDAEGPPRMFSVVERGLFGRTQRIGRSFPLPFGGRNWRLLVSPNPEFLARSQESVNWVLLMGGLLMTGVVGMFVMVATGREEALRHEIDTHTTLFRRQNESLRLLNNIAAARAASLPDQLQQVLRLARQHLQLEFGIISRIEGRTFYVEHAISPPDRPLVPGSSFRLGQTYCELTLEQGDALAIAEMSASPYASHPGFETFHLECYIAAPVLVHGRVFGTVSFSSARPYPRPFDEGDLEFIRLLARWLGAAIERDEAQDALMAAHRRLAAILDNSPVGIAIVGYDRVVMQANPAFCGIFGLRMEEVVGKSARVLYGSDGTFQEIGDKSMPLLGGGLTFDEDVPMSRRDGMPILVRLIARSVDSGDRNHGIVWAAEDVTERRAAETALRERQEFYEQIFTSGGAVKLLLDPQTGQIVDANPAAAQFYGLELERLRGQPIWTLDELPPEDSMAQLRSAQTDANSRFIHRHAMADGSHKDMEVFTGPLRVRGRDLLMSIIHDVTDRLQSERMLAQALREQEAQAQELARSNAELEQFAYVASHDLRQPLRQVASYVSLLERMYGDKLDDEGRQFVGFARSGAERMDRLIVDLLEYSRIGRKTRGMEPVPVTEMLTEPVRILSPLAEELNGRVILDVAADAGVIMGERIELERLFQNLIGNALKYKSADRPPEVVVRAVRDQDQGELLVSVSDNGIGIAAEHFDRIFGVFQRLHGRDEYDGTGIGLAVCKKIVDHHKGRIWLESTVGEGSVFHVALPLAEETE